MDLDTSSYIVESTNNISDVIVLLAAAVFVVTFFLRMKISPVIGYFVAGALIGVHGFGFITSHKVIDSFAEVGVVFLLFLIGLEISFERLIAMRRHVFGMGTLQVIITSSIIILICKYCFAIEMKAAIVIGMALALSSTAIVLQVLQDNGQQSTQLGRLSIAVLILQDFAVVPIFVLIPLLDAPQPHNIMIPILHALFKASIALIGIFIFGRLLLRPFFKIIASTKSNELFMATTLLIALGAAYITESMNLSMAMGAFLAGLLLAETEYRHEVEHVILPFKSLLLGLFFMSVGMAIDWQFLLSNFGKIFFFAIFIVILKSVIVILLCLIFGFKKGAAIQGGLILSQCSEFALVVLGLDASQRLIDPDLSNLIMVIVTVTMAITPLVAYIGKIIASKIEDKDKGKKSSISFKFHSLKNKMKMAELTKEIMDMDQHVIIIGFSHVGRVLSKFLVAGQIQYIALDIDKEIVSKSQKDGFSIFCGDGTKLNDLKLVAIERAITIVITVHNDILLRKILSLISSKYPHITVIVRSNDLSHVEMYKELGAKFVIPETYETGLQIGATVMSQNGISEYTLSMIKNRFRASNYSIFKDIELGFDNSIIESSDGDSNKD